MSKKTRTKRFFAGMGILLLVFILGYLVVRPWHLHWGATTEDVSRSMPGDLEHIGWTRAITIEAAPEQVWPWLVQWGQGRGGWYSYDWLENLFGFDIHTADSILPEYQDLKIGDPICMARGFCTSYVTVVESNQWLSWQAKDESGTPVWTFTFGLVPIDSTHTRLIVRESFNNTFVPPAAVVALEIPDAVMELKALNTVKDRTEGVTRSKFVTLLEIIVWFTAFAVCLITLVLFANRSDGRPFLALSIASVLVLLLVTFLFPPLWLRVTFDLVLVVGLFFLTRQQVQVTQLSISPNAAH
jgi:hypothetical protein